jgi:protease PrsW
MGSLMSLNGTLVWLGILQAVIYLLFIRAIDLYEREPLRYVIPVFIWGFTVATTVSLAFNTLFQLTLSSVTSVKTASFFTAVVEAPVVEECSKGAALLLIFFIAYLGRRRSGLVEFAGVMDGIVYGSAVGFGFAIAEDLLYGLQFGPETYIVRRIFGGFAHASFTSLTGIGIGLIPWVYNRGLKIILPMLGLSGAIMLHAAFNFTATVFGPVGYLVLFCVILVYIVIIFVWLAIERRTIREELRDEVSKGTITSQEYTILPSYFRTMGYSLKLIFTGRLLTWSMSRKVQATAVDLALAKRIARRTRSPGSMDRVRTLRRKILDLRGKATVQAAP